MRNAGVDMLTETKITPEQMRLDEVADLHERISNMATRQLDDSRRITRLEHSEHGSGDMFGSLDSMMWIMVLLTVAPVVIDLYRQWKSQPS